MFLRTGCVFCVKNMSHVESVCFCAQGVCFCGKNMPNAECMFLRTGCVFLRKEYASCRVYVLAQIMYINVHKLQGVCFCAQGMFFA